MKTSGKKHSTGSMSKHNVKKVPARKPQSRRAVVRKVPRGRS